MKKIIIITLSLFVLASCNAEVEKKTNNISEKKVLKEVKNVDTDIPEIWSNITFSDLKTNLDKLKKINLSGEDMDLLNSNIISIYNNKLQSQAIDENNISLCNKLDKNYVESCKKEIIIKSENIKNCDSLTEDFNKRSCKNSILKEQAISKLDEKICDTFISGKQNTIEWYETLVDTNENQFEINDCKNRVFEKQAIKNLDISICKKMPNKYEIWSCEELVKMQKENIDREEEIKKQDELLKNEQEKNKINKSNNLK